MKTIAGLILFSLFLIRAEASIINAASVSQADVSAAINSAANGDTVVIPAGTSTWTTGISVSGKAIKIQGAGSGRIIGRTLTSTTVGTGSKTFTTQSGLSITTGQTLRVVRRADGSTFSKVDTRSTYMEGTVTGYSGTTLVLNVTSTSGSGTYATWFIATNPLTTINFTGTSGQGFSLTAPSSGNIELSGIKLTSNHPNPAYGIRIFNGLSTTLIHDCWFSALVGGAQLISSATNTAVVWNCSFDAPFFQTELGIQFKWEDATGAQSWTTSDTIGMHDTNGNKNFYVEDCDFHYFLNAMDTDGNSRVVVRHCTFDNAGTGSHGADTGPYGTRHWEYYNNTHIFEPTTNGVVLPLNWWIFIRGGTGVITDNVMPKITSQDYPNKGSVTMIVENIRRNAGPYPCWTTYPAPHSAGRGNNGTSNTMLVGDFTDPIRVWNNTGGTDASNVGIIQYEPDECGNGTLATAFTKINRDYFFSTDSTAARSGYQKYTYPHPLRGSLPPAPQNLHTLP